MSGRILEFIVDKQRLTKNRKCDFTGLVAGTEGYLRAKFAFSKEWDDCAKIVTFWRSDDLQDQFPVKLDEDDCCDIPAVVTREKEFKISILGGKSGGYRINTGKLKIRQEVY